MQQIWKIANFLKKCEKIEKFRKNLKILTKLKNCKFVAEFQKIWKIAIFLAKNETGSN